jgi:hypothetical protein
MKKVMRIGTIQPYGRRWVSLYVKAEYDEKGRFSMSGVMGPTESGNCIGSCGQIDMGFAHRNPADDDKRYTEPIPPSKIRFAPGWNAEKWFDLLDVWKKWHLNDMQPGCEHQQDEGWGKEKIVIVSVDVDLWRVRGGVDTGKHSTVGRLIDKAMEAARRGVVYQPDGDAERSWIDGKVVNIKTETKASGWVRESEHPQGVLMKKCPVCGYQYGSAWKKKSVPVEVIDWVKGLPDADRLPAWI